MLESGPGTTSEASNLESRITVTTQDSSPGIQRLAVRRTHHQRNRMRYVPSRFMWGRVRNCKWVNGLEARGHHITTAAPSVAWLPVVAMVETIEARAELDTSGKSPIR